MLWSNRRGIGPSQAKSIVTIVTPADNYDLITVDEFKTDQGITVDTDDAKIALFITQASAVIASYCNRIFSQETISEQFRNVHSDTLILARFPVASITLVTECGTDLDATDYEVDPDTGLLSRLCGDCLSFWCASKVVAKYVCGYSVIPSDIKRACMDLVRYNRIKASRDPMLKSLELPGVSVESYWIGAAPGQSYNGIPPDTAALLDGYTARRVV